MGISLIVGLLVVYLALGTLAPKYNWRTRAILILVTVLVPGWFYVLWT